MSKNWVTVGVDIGGTNTVLGFIDNNGNFIEEFSFPTQASEGAEKFVVRLTNKINSIYAQYADKFILSGIGIAAPSANYLNGTIEDPANLKWGHVDFVHMMKKNFDLPIIIVNDANAAALGEKTFGSAKEMNNFIILTLGTGLGSGIIIDGNILHGQDGLAGELGHTAIEPNGRECSCGKSGCLETYVSAKGMCRTVFYLLSMYNEETELRNINYNSLTSKKISELALKNDPIAIKAFNLTGEILGRALANFAASFSPQAIILFGGLAEAGELLLKPTRIHFEKNLLGIYKNRVKIMVSELQNGKAAVLGACTLVWKEIDKTHYSTGHTQKIFNSVKGGI